MNSRTVGRIAENRGAALRSAGRILWILMAAGSIGPSGLTSEHHVLPLRQPVPSRSISTKGRQACRFCHGVGRAFIGRVPGFPEDLARPCGVLLDRRRRSLSVHGLEARERGDRRRGGDLQRTQEFVHLEQVQCRHGLALSFQARTHFRSMDWRHVKEVIVAGEEIYSELKNLCIWNKSNAGMGSLYRSKHELIFGAWIGGT